MMSARRRPKGVDSSTKDASNSGSSRPTTNEPFSSTKLTRPHAGSLERLPSVRPKRDLTLGGVPKRTFAPVIPAPRVKKESAEQTMGPSVPVNERKKVEEKKGGAKGKGKEKRKGKEILTSASVFSMGPAERTVKEKRESNVGLLGSVSGGSRGSKSSKELKSEATAAHHKTVSRPNFSEAEEEPMDTGIGMDVFVHSRVPPIQLPLDYSLHTKQKSVPTKSKVKQESGVEIGSLAPMTVEGTPSPQQTTAAELFNPTEQSKGQFLYIQLPDTLPLSHPVIKEEPMEETVDTATPSPVSPSQHNTVNGSKVMDQHYSLHDVPEGLIGKLRVHKSGKVKLVLGDVSLDVSMGTPCGFLQELVSIGANQSPSDLTVLGRLAHRIVCTPDLETMISGGGK